MRQSNQVYDGQAALIKKKEKTKTMLIICYSYRQDLRVVNEHRSIMNKKIKKRKERKQFGYCIMSVVRA